MPTTRQLFPAAAMLAAASAVPATAHDGANGPPIMNLDQVMAAFGLDFDAAEIETQKVADGLHVLFGLGGNIAVSSGEDGVLIVDDQFPQLMPKIKKALRAFADDDVDIAINTHWHFDHADGNLALGKEATQIVAQKNSRAMMTKDNYVNMRAFRYDQKAYPAHALPDITYENAMSFYFNGEEVALHHFGAAHTTGDTAVIFRERNAVHMGDVFNNTGFPFIDADNGGHVDGVIAFCEKILSEIDEETIVIPGHGPVTDAAEMTRYVEILKITRDRIQTLIDDGGTLEEIMAAAPVADFAEEVGADEQNVALYIDRVHAGLTRRE